MTIRTGAILAAGRARRMGPLGERVPKALLPLGPEPLLFHHLGVLRDLGCERALVAVGPQGGPIRKAVESRPDVGLDVVFVQVEPLGTAHAVARITPFSEGVLVVLLGDYGFDAPGLSGLVGRVVATQGSAAIAVKREPNLLALQEGSAVEVTERGLVARIEEKPAVPRSDLRGSGIYVFGPQALDAIRRAPPTPFRGEHELATGIQLFVDEGGTVFAEEIVEWDANLTSPADLLRGNLEWLQRHGLASVVGDGARLEEGTVLEQSVVGARAIVSRPTVFRQAVVLPDARFEGGGTIEHAIVANDDLIVAVNKR